jgi:uncharacterized protein (DUF1800 family)
MFGSPAVRQRTVPEPATHLPKQTGGNMSTDVLTPTKLEPIEIETAELPSAATLTAAGAAAALLAACGDGGTSQALISETSSAPLSAASTSPTNTATKALPRPTAAEASRFLGQASFTATDDQILKVQEIGYSEWLNAQFLAPREQGYYAWLKANGYVKVANRSNFSGIDNAIWRKLIASDDLLRQRIVLAFSEIFVVSLTGLQEKWRGPMSTHYMDLLETHAFGNYRDLLEAVTLSPCMGFYLNMRGNQKADGNGREPDENYAREILQLFSIGVTELNADGTPSGGAAKDAYDQSTITGLAKVFTGWDYDRPKRDDSPDYATKPMVLDSSKHDSGSKTFLKTTIAAGTSGQAAMKQALDTIANHPNVGPFIGRQLIQRLVTSNPSPDYVRRVAEAFNNNGFGQRGDFKAVIKAILLDPDARRAPSLNEITRGRLRPPMQRFIQWARTFKVESTRDKWELGDLSDPAKNLGQSPLRAPSVFNFYRPGYMPPNSGLAANGLTAPEFQINNETTMVAWSNFAQSFIEYGYRDCKPDYTAELALANNLPALVRRVSLLIAADSLSEATLQTIIKAVSSIKADNKDDKLDRVYASIHLVMCTPEYLVQI